MWADYAGGAGREGSEAELVGTNDAWVFSGGKVVKGTWQRENKETPARLVGQDKTTGSIKVGKTADLALVEGDPSTRIGDLRQTRTIVLGGKLLEADALRSAAGFSGRPH